MYLIVNEIDEDFKPMTPKQLRNKVGQKGYQLKN